MPARGTVKGGPRDVGRGDVRPGTPDVSGQIAGPAAEVKDAIPARHVGQREPAAQREVRGSEVLRQALPQIVVVLLHGVNVSPLGRVDTRGTTRIQCRAGNTEVQLMPTATVSDSASAPLPSGKARSGRSDRRMAA